MRPHADRPLIYLAAPLTIPEPIENTHVAVRVAERLQETQMVTLYVPHIVNLVWHLIAPHDGKYWLDYDYAILARADALLRLPGLSEGADQEVEFAQEHGIPVFHHESELLAWAQGAEV